MLKIKNSIKTKIYIYIYIYKIKILKNKILTPIIFILLFRHL